MVCSVLSGRLHNNDPGAEMGEERGFLGAVTSVGVCTVLFVGLVQHREGLAVSAEGW